MGYYATTIPIMIASPSDVAAERAIIREVIHAWNDTHALKTRTVLQPFAWETHARPEAGLPVQQHINATVLDHCDLLIAVFWTRIGSPTASSDGATIDEIEKHVDAGKTAMIYFSDRPPPLTGPQRLDFEQRKAVEQYRARCRERGILYGSYQTLENFKELVEKHVQMWLHDSLAVREMQSKLPVTARADAEATFFDEGMRKTMTPVQWLARNHLYRFGRTWVNAVWLWGTGTQNVGHDQVEVSYTHTPLDIPMGLRPVMEREIEKEKKTAVEKGRRYFNGPCTRLIDVRPNPRDGRGIAREWDIVHLNLGPCGWDEYRGLNGAIRDETEQSGLLNVARYYAALEEMLASKSVAKSKLSNILDTATTILTRDGYAGYQVRSQRVGAQPGWKTSSVAENINRWKDDSLASDPAALFNPNWFEETEKDNTYEPMGVPHPFAAVRRGIHSELSPSLLKRLLPGSIRLVGVSFDLGALHPDLLLVALLDATRKEVEEIQASHKGEEQDEGTLFFVPASSTSSETLSKVAEQEWIGAGLASLGLR